MLYTFGDSLSFGWNFYKQVPEDTRKEMAWPTMLSHKLDLELIDHSFPGTSNWRIARILQNIDLKPEDLVVVQLTGFDRTEIGVNENYDYQSTLLPENKFSLLDKPINENGVLVKPMCRTLIPHTTDKSMKKFTYHVYNTFWNKAWHLEMSKIMISSILYNLQKSGCKFIIFDGWIDHCKNEEFSYIPQYILRGTTLNNIVKGIPGVSQESLNYLTLGEQQRAAEVIYEGYVSLYGS